VCGDNGANRRLRQAADQDFLDDLEAARANVNPGFTKLVRAALATRKLRRA
jgi:hypothetical protein